MTPFLAIAELERAQFCAWLIESVPFHAAKVNILFFSCKFYCVYFTLRPIFCKQRAPRKDILSFTSALRLQESRHAPPGPKS